MYIEKLQTPHPNLVVPGQNPEPFVQAVSVSEAQAFLADAQLPTDDALFQVLDHTAEVVRDSLRYPKFDDNEEGANLKKEYEAGRFDALTELTLSQTTSCIGYAMVGSESLDAMGIEHAVCYMSGHWFTVVPYLKQGEFRLQLADMYKAGRQDAISQDLTEAVRSPWAGMFIGQIRSEGQSATKVDVDKFAGNLGMTSSSLAIDYNWLEQYGRSLILNPDTQGSQTFIMTGYSSERGRGILENYSYFNLAIAQGDMMQATRWLRRLEGSYPELDARAKHEQIFKLVEGLSEIGELALAARSISGYFAGIGQLSRDPRLSVVEGDVWRSLSRNARGTEIGLTAAELAAASYNTAANRTGLPAYRDMCLGKIATLRTLVA